MSAVSSIPVAATTAKSRVRRNGRSANLKSWSRCDSRMRYATDSAQNQDSSDQGHFFTVYKLCVVVNAGIYDLGRSRNEVATSQPRHFGSLPSSLGPAMGGIVVVEGS